MTTTQTTTSPSRATQPVVVAPKQEKRFQITHFNAHLEVLKLARTKTTKKGFLAVPKNTPSAWKTFFSQKSLCNGEKIYQSWIDSMQKEKGMSDKQKAEVLCVAMKNAYVKFQKTPDIELEVLETKPPKKSGN